MEHNSKKEVQREKFGVFSRVGSYNKVSVSIPFTLDRPSPLFTGSLRKSPGVPQLYIRHLPVTTEIARDTGVEFAGYPKFLADIEFEKQGDWVTCHLAEKNQHILTFAVRQLELHETPRSRIDVFTTRRGRILRSPVVSSWPWDCYCRFRRHRWQEPAASAATLSSSMNRNGRCPRLWPTTPTARSTWWCGTTTVRRTTTSRFRSWERSGSGYPLKWHPAQARAGRRILDLVAGGPDLVP